MKWHIQTLPTHTDYWNLSSTKQWIRESKTLYPLLSTFFRSFYWLFGLSVYVTLSLYLNIYERPIPKRDASFQSNKIIGTSTLLGGKDWAGPFFPSSKMYWSIYLSFSLLNYAALSLHLKLMYDLFKRENLVFKQQVYWYFCIVGWRKTGPIFPPSKIFLSFYLSFQSFGLCNSLNVSEQFKWPIPEWELSFLS